MPSRSPSHEPSLVPSTNPSDKPSRSPSEEPSNSPSEGPSGSPSEEPSSSPSDEPSNSPSEEPSSSPSEEPSSSPSEEPSSSSSEEPSSSPSERPSGSPSEAPSGKPSLSPSRAPSLTPSSDPSDVPSLQPSSAPSDVPSMNPSVSLKPSVSSEPSMMPSLSNVPSVSFEPSSEPSVEPSTSPSEEPSLEPSGQPSGQPSSRSRSEEPSTSPSEQPSTTSRPSLSPSAEPSSHPVPDPPLPIINEVLFLPRDTSIEEEFELFADDLEELGLFLNATNVTDNIRTNANQSAFDNVQGTFIELYRGDLPYKYDLSLCVLLNANNSSWLALEGQDGSDDQYRVVNTTDVFPLGDIDGLGLICNGTMADYVAWGQDGVGPNGTVHDMAVQKGHWIDGTVVETLYSVDFRQEYTLFTNSSGSTNTSNASFGETLQPPELDDPSLLTGPLKPGDSIGRNRDEEDNNDALDFSVLGGIDATGPSPGGINENPYLAWLSADCLYTEPGCIPNIMSRRDLHQSREEDQNDQSKSGKSILTGMEDGVERRNLDSDWTGRRNLQGPGRKWTVICYMDPSDPKFHNDQKKILMDLAFVGSTDLVQYLFQFGQYRFAVSSKGGLAGVLESVQSIETVSNWTTWRTNESGALCDTIKWAKTNYPASKYLLHMNAHGNGWKGLLVKSRPTTTWVMTMTELKDALVCGGGVDVLYFEMCLMAGVSVAYQIRNQVGFQVASEEVAWDLIDYNRLASTINFGLKFGLFSSGKDMAILFAWTYHWHASTYKSAKISGKYTVSVVDLSKLGDLIDELDTFADSMRLDMENVRKHDDLTDNHNVVYRSRALVPSEKFKDGNFRDLGDLATKVTKIEPPFFSKLSAFGVVAALRQGYNNMVVWEKHAAGRNCHGLHIYHPLGLLSNAPKNKQYDWTWPSVSLYALDKTHPILSKDPNDHSKAIEGGFDYPKDHDWDEFLIRFYKPTADACIRQGMVCLKSVEKKIGDTMDISGAGSSDGDPFPTHIFRSYWDTNLEKDDGGNHPEYKYNNWAIANECASNDCDRDDVKDEKDDDPDEKTTVWTYECVKAGTFQFKLWVWDNHQRYTNGIYKPDPLHNPNNKHWLHWQVDESTVTVTCTNATNTTNSSVMPSADPSPAPSASPSLRPSSHPSQDPSPSPSAPPSVVPSLPPSHSPSTEPTTSTDAPSTSPSSSPSTSSQQPSVSPSQSPSAETEAPSTSPSSSPSNTSQQPSASPSQSPSAESEAPSQGPTFTQTNPPSNPPSDPQPTSGTTTPTGTPSPTPGPHAMSVTYIRARRAGAR